MTPPDPTAQPDPSGQPDPHAPWTPPSGWSTEQPASWSGVPGSPPPPVPPPVPPQAGWGAPPTGQYPQQPGWGPPPAGGYYPPPQPGWGPPPAGGQYAPQTRWAPPPQAPKPGIVPLRPLSVGELLEGGLGFIRSNPRTILGLAAILSLAVAVVQTLGTWAALSVFTPVADDLVAGNVPGDQVAELSGLLAVSLAQAIPAIVTGLLQIVFSGLFIVLVAAAVLGRTWDAGTIWTLLRPRLPALIGLTLLLVLGGSLVIAVGTGVVVSMVALLGLPGALIAFLLALGLLVCVTVVYVRVAVAAPALVLEGAGSVTALTRSWRLVGGSWWRVLGVLVLTAVITAALTAVVSVPVGMLTTLFVGLEPSVAAAVLSAGVTTLVAGVVTWPFTAAVSGLLYVDLRIRKEQLHHLLYAEAQRPDAGSDPLAAYRWPGDRPR